MSSFHIPSRQATITRSDSTPPDVPLSFDLEIVHSTTTRGTPPQIEITIKNTGCEEWTYSTDYSPVFSGFVNENPPPQLFLVPSDQGVEYSESELRLVPNTFAPDAIQYESSISPGGGETNRYKLLDSRENGVQHYPPGTYRFVQDVRACPSGQDEQSTFSWGFELTVSSVHLSG